MGTTSSAFYVWGIDRGAGTEKFNTGANPIGAGVKFDTVVIFRLDGTRRGRAARRWPTTSRGAATRSRAACPTRCCPRKGLAFEDYTWNLWPRDGTVTGNAAISDFAPDASNAGVTAVPEPASLALLGAGLALIAGRGAPSPRALTRSRAASRGYSRPVFTLATLAHSHDEKRGIRVIPRVVSFE